MFFFAELWLGRVLSAWSCGRRLEEQAAGLDAAAEGELAAFDPLEAAYARRTPSASPLRVRGAAARARVTPAGAGRGIVPTVAAVAKVAAAGRATPRSARATPAATPRKSAPPTPSKERRPRKRRSRLLNEINARRAERSLAQLGARLPIARHRALQRRGRKRRLGIQRRLRCQQGAHFTARRRIARRGCAAAPKAEAGAPLVNGLGG